MAAEIGNGRQNRFDLSDDDGRACAEAFDDRLPSPADPESQPKVQAVVDEAETAELQELTGARQTEELALEATHGQA